LLGFIAVLALRSRPADPEARLPERFRLAGLINREQATVSRLRTETEDLRRQVDAARRARAGRRTGAQEVDRSLAEARVLAGLAPVHGPGMKVVLDDSDLKESPTGNVNDLVIHSQDVQAVVNGLWRAGAEALAVNGQRLVSTSGVLCVGNTLLLNGTVHSPPYVLLAVGANRPRFEADAMVRRLHDDADAFGLRFSVSREDDVELPGFDGVVQPQFAKASS
jgi:uncharacterized protein YlxW (UPF0749 family)